MQTIMKLINNFLTGKFVFLQTALGNLIQSLQKNLFELKSISKIICQIICYFVHSHLIFIYITYTCIYYTHTHTHTHTHIYIYCFWKKTLPQLLFCSKYVINNYFGIIIIVIIIITTFCQESDNIKSFSRIIQTFFVNELTVLLVVSDA